MGKVVCFDTDKIGWLKRKGNYVGNWGLEDLQESLSYFYSQHTCWSRQTKF